MLNVFNINYSIIGEFREMKASLTLPDSPKSNLNAILSLDLYLNPIPILILNPDPNLRYVTKPPNICNLTSTCILNVPDVLGHQNDTLQTPCHPESNLITLTCILNECPRHSRTLKQDIIKV
jgi:hypothetical protein